MVLERLYPFFLENSLPCDFFDFLKGYIALLST